MSCVPTGRTQDEISAAAGHHDVGKIVIILADTFQSSTLETLVLERQKLDVSVHVHGFYIFFIQFGTFLRLPVDKHLTTSRH